MIAAQSENETGEEQNDQRLGEAWIRAISERTLDRLAELCHRRIIGRLLLPGGFVTISNVADLIAKYRDWFGEYSDFQLELSRVARVGNQLGIHYLFLLQDHGTWYRVEQDLFCRLRDGRVQMLYLLCSGFQPVAPRLQDGDLAIGGISNGSC